MDIGVIVNTNLKKIRAEKGYSLTKLAGLSGVSKGMLSQIENGGTSPTINTIWKICAGLGVPYTTLLEDHPGQPTITHKNQAVRQNFEDGHYRLYRYYYDLNHHNFELFQLELDPRTTHTPDRPAKVNRNGQLETTIMVLKGQLTVSVSDDQFILNPDDALRFDSTHKHRYQNTGTGVLKAILINFYPV